MSILTRINYEVHSPKKFGALEALGEEGILSGRAGIYLVFAVLVLHDEA